MRRSVRARVCVCVACSKHVVTREVHFVTVMTADCAHVKGRRIWCKETGRKRETFLPKVQSQKDAAGPCARGTSVDAFTPSTHQNSPASETPVGNIMMVNNKTFEGTHNVRRNSRLELHQKGRGSPAFLRHFVGTLVGLASILALATSLYEHSRGKRYI